MFYYSTLIRRYISSPVRNSYLSILPDDNADIFAAYLLISYCRFSTLILSSIVMISFYILSKGLFLKHEELSDARVVSITKTEYGFAKHFLLRFKSFESQYLMNDLMRFVEALLSFKFSQQNSVLNLV